MLAVLQALKALVICFQEKIEAAARIMALEMTVALDYMFLKIKEHGLQAAQKTIIKQLRLKYQTANMVESGL